MSLSSLPLEIFHAIIGQLDLISILDLSLTSQATRSQVRSHNIYHLLTTNDTTRSTLRILSQTHLIQRHTLSTLSSALQAQTCSCCQRDQAPYLSLPLGTRACFTCLHDCPQFQLIPVSLAASTFVLPEATFASIALCTVPGMYRTNRAIYSCRWSYPLVNVMQARDLAVEVKGADDLDRCMAGRGNDVTTYVAPLAVRTRFVTPYTGMRLDVCTVPTSSEELIKSQDSAAASGDRLGLTVLGCEQWPRLFKKNRLRLDRGPVEGWRMRNDYKLYKHQKVPETPHSIQRSTTTESAT